MGGKYIINHRLVRDTMVQLRAEMNTKGIIVSELAKEIEMDPRVLKKHLEVMEIDGVGHFSDKKKKHIFVLDVR